jgi:HPt (histidine-containing phosphotransfer) domain-containing protein
MGGNRSRYESLLRRFAQQQATAVGAIRQSLSSGDVATAERTAHSLKGAAGTLGAMAVSAAAAKAETAIRKGQGIDPALTSLSDDLSKAVEAILTSLPAEGIGSGHSTASVDAATVIEPLTRLKRLLENDDGEAADFIIDTRSNLSGVLTDMEIENLNELIGDFNFEAALACLSRIISRLERNIEAGKLES